MITQKGERHWVLTENEDIRRTIDPVGVGYVLFLDSVNTRHKPLPCESTGSAPKTVWTQDLVGKLIPVLHIPFIPSGMTYKLKASFNLPLWLKVPREWLQFWHISEAPRPRLGGSFLMDGWTDGWHIFDHPSSTFSVRLNAVSAGASAGCAGITSILCLYF